MHRIPRALLMPVLLLIFPTWLLGMFPLFTMLSITVCFKPTFCQVGLLPNPPSMPFAEQGEKILYSARRNFFTISYFLYPTCSL